LGENLQELQLIMLFILALFFSILSLFSNSPMVFSFDITSSLLWIAIGISQTVLYASWDPTQYFYYALFFLFFIKFFVDAFSILRERRVEI